MKKFNVTISYDDDILEVEANTLEEAVDIANQNAEEWRHSDPATIQDLMVEEVKK